MSWSNEELVAEAGVDPWELRDDLAEGNPAEIIGLAQQFHTAAGQATDTWNIAGIADEITGAGYEVDDTPVHDVTGHLEQTRVQLGGSGDNIALIARDLATIADELATRTTSADGEIEELESELEELRAELDRAAEAPTAENTAGPPPRVLSYDMQAPVLKERAIEFVRDRGQTIQELVDGYEEVLNSRLRAMADMGYEPPAELDVGDPNIPPAGTDSQQVNDWWESLSPYQQRELIAEQPERIGNLDGIPAAVRDEANRARLDDERDALEAERDRLQQNLDNNLFGGLFTNDDARLDHANAKLESLDHIERTLEQGNRQLLLLDLSGQRAEAAVAVGDVGTADHVAVFTPGLDSTVNGKLKNYDDDMEQLQRQAEFESNRYGDGGSVATVTWIGYQAPQSGLEGFNPLDSNSVLRDDTAREGGTDLADFYRGINASRATDPHLTALGHSYGSTTTGFALKENTGVDDAVFFGSPGIGTSHIENLEVPEEHSYRIEARRDWVADTGVFGIDPSHMDGMTGLSAREETLPDGRHLNESVKHSNYLNQDSTSQYNMSVVVAGQHDRVVQDDG